MKKTDCESLDIIVGNPDYVSKLVAEHIGAQLAAKGRLTLGAAGGSSTAGVYAALRSNTDLSGITVFTPDEYFGTTDQLDAIRGNLPRAKVYSPSTPFLVDEIRFKLEDRYDEMERLDGLEPRSRDEYPDTWLDIEVKKFMEHLYRRIADGVTELIADISTACEQYEKEIKETDGIDILLLGLGADPDGHIASIMPGEMSVNDRTHLERYQTPHKTSKGETNYAVTMGIGTMLDAKEIVLLAFGDKKADSVQKSLYGPIDGKCPASYLRNSQNKILVCLDYNAAKNL